MIAFERQNDIVTETQDEAEEIEMTLGNKLAKLRKENNYTQEQSAYMLGVSRQAISKWESDLAYPETEKLIRLSEMYHCSLDYLLKDRFNENGENLECDAKFYLQKHIREKRSKITIGGLPLWHISKDAKGIIAVGIKARGVIAVGLKARGILSVGMLSMGFISFGMLSLGLLSIGLFSLGFLAAGCLAVGIFSTGAISFGVISLGAIAIGEFSIGAIARGNYFAWGDYAQAKIALGDSRAIGSSFHKLGKLTSEDMITAKKMLDATVPGYFAWAKEIVKLFIS